MIEATSIARVNRALRTRTTPSAEGRFNVGDVVEIHRPADSEDVSGWAGPGTVVSVDPSHGKCVVRYQKAEMNCRIQDVRTFIGAVFAELGTGMPRAGLAWDLVQNHIEQMPAGSGARNFGHWVDYDGVRKTEYTRQYPEVYQALCHISQNCMQLSDVCHSFSSWPSQVGRLARMQPESHHMVVSPDPR